MLVPTHKRLDRTMPVITAGFDGKIEVGLDNNTPAIKKKFKCSVCGGTVFQYYDRLRFLFPIDVMDAAPDILSNYTNAPDEVECTHYFPDEHGIRRRCNTVYVIFRG